MAIYVSEYAEYTPMRSNGKPIVKFRPYMVLDPHRKEEVKKGVIVLDDAKDAKIIKELEAFPDFGHGYKKVDKIPTRVNRDGYIIDGVRTATAGENMTKQNINELKVKFQRLYELKEMLFNKNGSLKANIDENDERITELENLQEELEKEN